jgi:hypothetical protein
MSTRSSSFHPTLSLLGAVMLLACGSVGAQSLPANFPAGLTNTAIVSSTSVVTPYMERFEQVAADGNGGSGIVNQWGGHQVRVTHHNDGSVRLLYISLNTTTGAYNWKLLRRSSAVAPDWKLEASGTSNDDISLLRDPVTDQAYVVAWPNSVPTIYASPSYAPVTIPGTWESMSPNSRHYGGVGIAPDGTLCIKASVELPTSVPTTSTNTVYECGKHVSATGGWSWQPQVTHYIGLRHAYDYLFPGGFGDASQLVATAQYDLYKDAAGLPNLNTSYVFNGLRFYATGVGSAASWYQSDPAAPLSEPVTTVNAPVERPMDNFIDSQRRIWNLYSLSDPSNLTPAGIYLSITDSNGSVIYKQKLALPTYGYARHVEDAKGRHWLLYTNQGSQATQFQLYPVTVNATATPMTVTLGAMVDLSRSVAPYSIQAEPLLSVQRGGQTVGNVLEGEFAACQGTYVSGQSLVCSPNGTTNTQRIFHFRVRLPD